MLWVERCWQLLFFRPLKRQLRCTLPANAARVSKQGITLLPAVQDAVTLTLTHLYVAWPALYMLIYNLITCPLHQKKAKK